MKKLISYLYKLYPRIFHELVVQDLVGQIPKPIHDNAIAVFEERRDSLVKWFLYQSYLLQRRAVADVKKADFYLGMLTNIKVYLTLLDSGGVKPKEKEVKKITPKPDISGEIASVEKFRKGLKK